MWREGGEVSSPGGRRRSEEEEAVDDSDSIHHDKNEGGEDQDQDSERCEEEEEVEECYYCLTVEEEFRGGEEEEPSYSPLHRRDNRCNTISWAEEEEENNIKQDDENDDEEAVYRIENNKSTLGDNDDKVSFPFALNCQMFDEWLPFALRSSESHSTSFWSASSVLKTIFVLFTRKNSSPIREMKASSSLHSFYWVVLEWSLVAAFARVGYLVFDMSHASHKEEKPHFELFLLCIWTCAAHICVLTPFIACFQAMIYVLRRSRRSVHPNSSALDNAMEENKLNDDFEKLQSTLRERQEEWWSQFYGECNDGTSMDVEKEVWRNILEDDTSNISQTTRSSSNGISSLHRDEVREMLAQCLKLTSLHGLLLEKELLNVRSSHSPKEKSRLVNSRLLYLFLVDMLPVDVRCILEYIDSPHDYNWEMLFTHRLSLNSHSSFWKRSIVLLAIGLCASICSVCIGFSLYSIVQLFLDINVLSRNWLWIRSLLVYFAVDACISSPLCTLCRCFLLPFLISDAFFLVRNHSLEVMSYLQLNSDDFHRNSSKSGLSTFFFASKRLAARYPACAASRCLLAFEPASSLFYLFLTRTSRGAALSKQCSGSNRVAPSAEQTCQDEGFEHETRAASRPDGSGDIETGLCSGDQHHLPRSMSVNNTVLITITNMIISTVMITVTSTDALTGGHIAAHWAGSVCLLALNTALFLTAAYSSEAVFLAASAVLCWAILCCGLQLACLTERSKVAKQRGGSGLQHSFPRAKSPQRTAVSENDSSAEVCPDDSLFQESCLPTSAATGRAAQESLVESYVKAATVREAFDQDKLQQYKEQLLQRVAAKIQLKRRLHNETQRRNGRDVMDLSGDGQSGGYKSSVSSAEVLRILRRRVDSGVESTGRVASPLPVEKIVDIHKRVVHLTHTSSAAEYHSQLEEKKSRSQALLQARLSQRRNHASSQQSDGPCIESGDEQNMSGTNVGFELSDEIA